jgi:hypothetical protein
MNLPKLWFMLHPVSPAGCFIVQVKLLVTRLLVLPVAGFSTFYYVVISSPKCIYPMGINFVWHD